VNRVKSAFHDTPVRLHLTRWIPRSEQVEAFGSWPYESILQRAFKGKRAVTTDGTPGSVKGTFDGKNLRLSRETGLQTIQHYHITVNGNRFTGTFYNQGKYPDRGSFEGTRH